MNFLFVMAAAVAIVFITLSFFLFLYAERYRKQAKRLEVELASASGQSAGWQREAEDMRNLRQERDLFLKEKSVAVTQRAEAEKKLEELRREHDANQRQREEAVNARMEAEKQHSLIQQRMAESEKRMIDWETQRAESLKATRASILDAGTQLSSKLLEDHKREAEAAKKESETAVRKASEALIEQMTNVTKAVSQIQGRSEKYDSQMATIMRALTTPGGAGNLAEVGLENSLKNLNLEAGRDFVMQYTVTSEEAGRLRPDAVVFLPQNMVMAIDSKASKFLMEIAEIEQGGDETAALQKLKASMNRHLNALISKDYGKAIQTAFKEAGRADMLRTTLNVMYLPSESAVAHIQRADPEFIDKTQRAGIILAGPANLCGLLLLAKLEIGLERQAANQDKIVEGVQKLMENIVTVLEYAESVGKGIKSASDHFGKFARSVNSRLLPKAQQLLNLGAKSDKKLPSRIASYEMRALEDMMVIEGEVETVEELNVIEAFPQKASA